MRIKDIVNRCNRALFFMRPYKNYDEYEQNLLDKWHKKGWSRIPSNPQFLATFKNITTLYKTVTSLYFEDYQRIVDKQVARVLVKLNYALISEGAKDLKYVDGEPVWIYLTEKGKESTSSVSSDHWIFDGIKGRQRKNTRPRKYYKWLRTLSKGSVVACCYDGKWGRAVQGIVVKRNSSNIWVKFIPWATEDKVEITVKFTEGEGYNTGSSQMGLMYSMGCKGDFYSLCPLEGNPTPKNMDSVPLSYLIGGGSVKLARKLKEAMDADS